MSIMDMLLGEYTQEASQTRKVLERIPIDKVDFQPHEKSMTLGRLAAHVCDLAAWTGMVLNAPELDLAGGYVTPPFATSEELLAIFDKNVAMTTEALQAAKDESLDEMWTLRSGAHVIMTIPRGQCLRGLCFNHTVHHRGQLSVYLRLVGVPVPGMYGPSADEM